MTIRRRSRTAWLCCAATCASARERVRMRDGYSHTMSYEIEPVDAERSPVRYDGSRSARRAGEQPPAASDRLRHQRRFTAGNSGRQRDHGSTFTSDSVADRRINADGERPTTASTWRSRTSTSALGPPQVHRRANRRGLTCISELPSELSGRRAPTTCRATWSELRRIPRRWFRCIVAGTAGKCRADLAHARRLPGPGPARRQYH